MRRYVFDGGTAVITGAASGIGAALARGLADRGSHLVLLDRDGEGVAGVAESICATLPQLRIATYVATSPTPTPPGGSARAWPPPIPTPRCWSTTPVSRWRGGSTRWTPAQFDAAMAVNFHAVVTMTRALLPVLTAHPGSHVVALSSIFGIVAPPGQTAYCATTPPSAGSSVAARRAGADGRRGDLRAPGRGADEHRAQRDRGRPAAGRAVGGGPRPVRPAADPATRPTPRRSILRAVHRRRPRVLVGRECW